MKNHLKNCDSSNNQTIWGVYWTFEPITVPQVASGNIQQNKLQYKLKMFGVFVVVQHFSKLKKPEQFTSYLQSLLLKLKISDKDMLQLSKQEDSSAPSRLPRVSRCWDLTRNLFRILEKNGQPIQCCPTWKLVVQHWWGDIRLARSRSYGCLELRINLSHSRIGKTCWMVTRLQCLHG